MCRLRRLFGESPRLGVQGRRGEEEGCRVFLEEGDVLPHEGRRRGSTVFHDTTGEAPRGALGGGERRRDGEDETKGEIERGKDEGVSKEKGDERGNVAGHRCTIGIRLVVRDTLLLLALHSLLFFSLCSALWICASFTFCW